MSKLIDTFVTLPQDLVNDFEKIDFTKSEKNHALKFLDNLMKRSYREYGMIDGFVETPSNYFRKVFTTKYLDWLNKLIFAKIIISNNSYSNSIHNIYSKSYSINNKYTLTPIMLLLFDKSSLKSIPYTFKIANISDEEKMNFKKVVEDLSSIKVDKKSLISITAEEVDRVSISDFKVNEEVTRDAFNVYFQHGNKKNKKEYWMTKGQAIKKSVELGQSLIQDESKFYIADEYEFILRKKSSMLITYNDSINKMFSKKFYGKRNSTNNRLDTNLTNMAKILTDEMCHVNNYIQFDLCNAQFCILCNILESELDTEDFIIFKEHSYNGTLYEYIMGELKIENRAEAKKMMFELMFSKETLKSELKRKLKSLFPSVVKKVDDYKELNGYNTFSIMLQKRESEIFIDGLWKELKKKGIFCTPKHDCLIVKEKDAEKVEILIEDYFKKIKFKGKIVRE